MTRHRKAEDWIEHILKIAEDELIREGYDGLTMDAIAAKAELSKGGIYRFFRNKQEVALGLFTKHYRELLEFDLEEAVAWNISMPDTIHRILFGQWEDATQNLNQRVWVELVSQTARVESFAEERERMHLLLRDKFRVLVERLAGRDHLQLNDNTLFQIDTTLLLGIALLEGLVLQRTAGTLFREQSLLAKRFIEVMLKDTFALG